MTLTVAVFSVLFGASVLLGLWFVAELGPPWRSALPEMAWLQSGLAAIPVLFDLAFLFVLWRLAVPVWVFGLILLGQDVIYAWRLRILHRARRQDVNARQESVMVEWLSKARKAIAAAVGSAVVLFVAAISDGDITAAEWGAIASAVVIGAITYATQNRGLPGGSEPPSASAIGRPPTRGY